MNTNSHTQKYIEQIIDVLSKIVDNNTQIIYEIFNGYSSEDLPPHHVIKIVKRGDNIDTCVPIIIIADYYGMCISTINDNGTNIINYNYWLSRMYEHKIAFYGESTPSEYDIYTVIRNVYQSSDNIDWMINSLISDQTNYLSSNNLIGYEASIDGKINRYQAFIQDCNGIDLRLNSTEYKKYAHKNNSIIIPHSQGVYSPYIEMMIIGENTEIKPNKIDELTMAEKTKEIIIGNTNAGGKSQIQKLGSIIEERSGKKIILYLPANFYGALIERKIYVHNSSLKLLKEKKSKSNKNNN